MDLTYKPILLVEDDPNDVLFMSMAMQKAGVPNPMHVANDGRDALAFLRGAGKYANRDEYPLPCLVLLDLRLPLMPGFEVLTWIRDRTQFQTLVVIVFTSSSLEVDIERAYRLGANAYLSKPSNPNELFETIRALKDFWLRTALLVPHCADPAPALQPSFRFEILA